MYLNALYPPSLRSDGVFSSIGTVFPSHIALASVSNHQSDNSIFLSHHSSASLPNARAFRPVRITHDGSRAATIRPPTAGLEAGGFGPATRAPPPSSSFARTGSSEGTRRHGRRPRNVARARYTPDRERRVCFRLLFLHGSNWEEKGLLATTFKGSGETRSHKDAMHGVKS